MKQYWLVKQEPEAYSWATFATDGKTAWTGIRNYQARNNMRAMKVGDNVLYYHSVSEKAVVGIAKVTKTAYPDPTATEGDWSCVDLEPVKPLKKPVSLETIKADPALQSLLLVRHTRLSLMPVGEAEFARILQLGATK